MIDNTIRNCRLFSGMTDDQLVRALEFFSASGQVYKKGEFLHTVGEPLRRFGLLISGAVQVYMDDIDGHQMIMANVSPGATFGEALAFLGDEAPIYICAAADSEVLWMNTDRVRMPRPEDSELVSRFIAAFAERTLNMNDRIQMLSKLTLREKLITFFSQQMAQNNSSDFVIPFSRSDMAAYLGSDRSALSRELSKMHAEGIIDYKGSHFIIKKHRKE